MSIIIMIRSAISMKAITHGRRMSMNLKTRSHRSNLRSILMAMMMTTTMTTMPKARQTWKNQWRL
jgi:hypothetical protein